MPSPLDLVVAVVAFATIFGLAVAATVAMHAGPLFVEWLTVNWRELRGYPTVDSWPEPRSHVTIVEPPVLFDFENPNPIPDKEPS